jgi:hypothetical protein
MLLRKTTTTVKDKIYESYALLEACIDFRAVPQDIFAVDTHQHPFIGLSVIS